MSLRKSQAFLAADVDRIQDFVFESERLPEIRGASRMVDNAIANAAKHIQRQGGEIIIAGGGSLLAMVPETLAPEIARHIETSFSQHTVTATITVDWRPLNTPWNIDDTDKAFGRIWQWAGAWLRRKKESRNSAPWIEAFPFAERCHSCHVRPADPGTLDTYEDMVLCSICKAKRDYRGRDAWFQDFQQYLKTLDPTKSSEKAKDLQDIYYRNIQPFPDFNAMDEKPRWIPQDIDELGQSCRTRPGYIGMIYLDGDDMGTKFEECETSSASHSLSELIHKTARKAVFQSLAYHLTPVEITPSSARPPSERLPEGELLYIHPFEILMIGGDDIILIVPADAAIPIATEISIQFTQMMKEQGTKISLSGGVVLAKDNNPIRVLLQRVRELKSSAKTKRYKDKADEGYIDFSVITGTEVASVSLTQEREAVPYTIKNGAQENLHLFSRPYPASTLKKIWESLHNLRGNFSNSQMSLLVRSLLEGQQKSRAFYQYQSSRLSDQYSELDKILKISGVAKQRTYPWLAYQQQTTSVKAETSLLDIAELYSFVPTTGENVYVPN